MEPPAIICAQAGNVNTGAVDPLEEICAHAHAQDAWVHVDGAFGLWAAASPSTRDLLRGVDQADTWAMDCHKWLNTPYDCGVVISRESAPLLRSMNASAAYILEGGPRDPYVFTPEMSRRTRGVEVWAALRALGRSGVADLVDRCCRHARRFAEGLSRAGFEILNEVVLNQVLVSFGDSDRTRRVAESVQRGGVCWCGTTEWQGRTAMRISVSSWATTGDDVDASIAAMIDAARA